MLRLIECPLSLVISEFEHALFLLLVRVLLVFWVKILIVLVVIVVRILILILLIASHYKLDLMVSLQTMTMESTEYSVCLHVHIVNTIPIY